MVVIINSSLDPYYSNIIRNKVHLMIKNKVRPTIQTSRIENTSKFENYSSLMSLSLSKSIDVEKICDYILSDIESCAYDYPERYVNLIGYSLNNDINNEYISDIYVIKNPNIRDINM
jgi:ribulose bisphosphate carboxylase small subunit